MAKSRRNRSKKRISRRQRGGFLKSWFGGPPPPPPPVQKSVAPICTRPGCGASMPAMILPPSAPWPDRMNSIYKNGIKLNIDQVLALQTLSDGNYEYGYDENDKPLMLDEAELTVVQKRLQEYRQEYLISGQNVRSGARKAVLKRMQAEASLHSSSSSNRCSQEQSAKDSAAQYYDHLVAQQVTPGANTTIFRRVNEAAKAANNAEAAYKNCIRN